MTVSVNMETNREIAEIQVFTLKRALLQYCHLSITLELSSDILSYLVYKNYHG